jgi:thiamine kinase-like enzyme
VSALKHLLGNDWEVTPAGGATGEAFVGTLGKEKIFMKRNSSPFLAVLSAEGIVPKLLWTKRLENGDVITAQKWLPGRELKAHEMGNFNVANLLSKIHRSEALLSMLRRIGKEPLEPINIIEELAESLKGLPFHIQTTLQIAVEYLCVELPQLEDVDYVVCHSDLNHNNWLLSESENLYLIDWDGAVIADPALDLGMLLSWYVPKENWAAWLQLQYGVELTDSLNHRMNWYMIAQTMQELVWHYQKKNSKEISFLQNYLRSFREIWQIPPKFELFPGN